LPEGLAQLRTDLATRALGLAGRPLPLEGIYGDTDGWLAVVGVAGETYRLYHQGGLVLVRPCAYCVTSSFESPEISDRVDLGYALSAWRPLHDASEDYDASETLAHW
jgi:hypothetical protein